MSLIVDTSLDQVKLSPAHHTYPWCPPGFHRMRDASLFAGSGPNEPAALAAPPKEELLENVGRTLWVFTIPKLRGGYSSYDTQGRPSYDVLPDGRHFVMVGQAQNMRVTRFNIVLNWLVDLKRSVPRK